MATTTQAADLSAIVASIKRRQSLANRVTGPQFLVVGDAFRIDGDTWTGPVVASPDAIYLFELTLGYAPVTSPPDLLSIPKDAPQHRALVSVDARNLPSAIVDHPDWPLARGQACEVVVLTREQICGFTRHTLSRWIELMLDGAPLRISCEAEQPALVVEFLCRNGWSSRQVSEHSHFGSSSQLAALGLMAGFALLVMSSIIVACSSWVGSQLGMLLMIVLAGGFAALLYGLLHVYTAGENAHWDTLLSGRKPGASVNSEI